jgi:hypothetical protein
MAQLLKIILGLSAIAVLAACGGHKHAHEHEDGSHDEMHLEAEQSGPEYTSAYICPMHCKGSGSDQAGTCPVCGMDYVANKDHKETDHEGHDHDDHKGHDHD